VITAEPFFYFDRVAYKQCMCFIQSQKCPSQLVWICFAIEVSNKSYTIALQSQLGWRQDGWWKITREPISVYNVCPAMMRKFAFFNYLLLKN